MAKVKTNFLFKILLVACCFISVNSYSQDTTHRKKIGLVLSGGGAKGFAHIGVLKVLEKAGVKIDYIGGTSMGAVVGGLYASGYNATQIDSIFEYTNFDELLQDYIPRTSKSFYEKRNDEMYAVSLPFSKFKIGVPIALSKGMYNYNLIAKLTHNVRHIRDFNKLPIPFVCVATDIEKGEEVILRKGYLAQAMMASSAFPSLFSPVEINGKILIDGGVTNNYPVEELRKMGAEIIIGVDVQDDLKDREALNDATRILVQITNLDMINKMKEKVKLTDVYIKPNVEDYGVISFSEGKEIIKKGEEAALLKIDQINELGNQTNPNPLQFVKNETSILNLKKIELTRLDNYTRAFILGKLRLKTGKKITYQDLKNGINNLNATQNFSRINYTIDKFEDGDVLQLNLVENNTKTFLKIGLHYDDLYKSALLINLTQKKIMFKNDVLSCDLILGDNIRYNLDYYIDNGFYWSFGFKSWYNTFNRNVANDFRDGEILNQLGVDKLNIDFSDFTNQAYMQTVFIQKYLIGAGIEYKHLKIETATIENGDSVFEDSNYFNIFGHLKYDSFDNKYFPKSGWLFYGDFKSYLYSSNYTGDFNEFSVAKGEISFAQTLFKKLTVKVQSEAGFKIGNESVDFFNFVLGGYGYNAINNFKHFYGYDYLSVAADSFIKSNFTFDYEIFKKNHINFSANYANLEDGLFRNGNWLSKPKFTGYAFGYGVESIVGPIEVKYSWSPELPKGYLWVSAGFWF
ncbi:patatin-like phospholipase family protein [Flavobacterium capsici]|uniref:Patatin-like phospholipase family protein n=1 Tax=Flavobacterium capsici TaxID=3075618 RepID=A0AA96EYP5_9FLAO|nr:MULTISPECIES: patatin-like phospholipase family protein [unclassified Flavobacterium]WNM19515.1 patatin-like phospholipase family protein [Flavobacterium sp. PMR2A8]WNM20904.1 patatin-like phospholipase family protein [Flavobacterium sp. PMTSA4]